MHPTEILSQEHRAIEVRLNDLEVRIRALEPAAIFPRAFFDEALDFFRHFADGCHHAKEENLLFPLLKERGVPEQGGPIGVMLAEHDEGRAYLKAVRDNLDAAERGSATAREAVCASAEAYIDLLRRHIYKEDHILFRMAQMVLQPDDVAELQKQFAAVEVPERFQEFAAIRTQTV
ncbi:MAG: hemerythrin domain-containing protein [Acidobacteriia bacterium]|nr:hemerythrin domain-containing protein [Terriglobia bacterium]